MERARTYLGMINETNQNRCRIYDAYTDDVYCEIGRVLLGEKYMNSEHKPIIKYAREDQKCGDESISCIENQIEYINSNGIDSEFKSNLDRSIHIGQRKLLICEIQHLTAKLDSHEEEAVVIYAGSAPGNHAWYLHLLFPNLKFVYVDPNEFFLYINEYSNTQYMPNNVESDKYVYLSYAENPKYNENFLVNKSIKYYNSKTNKLDFILNKMPVRKGFNQKRRNKQYEIHNRISPVASQESFDYVFNSNHAFYFCEEFFTTEVARKLRNSIDKYVTGKPNKKTGKDMKVIFWSDIRSVLHEERPSNLDLMWNNAMTYSWVRVIEPDFAMLKFHLLYPKDETLDFNVLREHFDEAKQLGFDFEEQFNETGEFSYFDGEIYLQAWNLPKGSESRLWLDKQTIVDNKMVVWPFIHYDESFAFYNKMVRFGIFHRNENAQREIGFDYCNDCAIENVVLTEYIEKFKIKSDVKFHVANISAVLGRRLINPGRAPAHGYLFRESPNIFDASKEYMDKNKHLTFKVSSSRMKL